MIKSNYLMYSSSQPSFLLNPVYVRLCLMNVHFYSKKRKRNPKVLYLLCIAFIRFLAYFHNNRACSGSD